MKKELPPQIAIAIVVIVVLVIGLIGFKRVFRPRPAVVPGGVHVTPPSYTSHAGVEDKGAPKTGG